MDQPESGSMGPPAGRRRGRKRSHDGSIARSSSKTNDANTERSENANDNEQDQQQQEAAAAHFPSPAQTPKRSQKRVRFSFPPDMGRAHSGTTGLTPALTRTFLRADEEEGPQTPSRRARQRPASLTLPDPVVDPIIPSPNRIRVQFTPLRQILDPRTRRHLWRTGLSVEMNTIHEENKGIKKAEAQIKALSEELAKYKSSQPNTPTDSPVDPQNQNLADNFDTIPVEDDTLDESILMSDSPAFRRHYQATPESDDSWAADMSPQTPAAESGVQVQILGEHSMDYIQDLSDDLSAARKEKQDLFNEWRKLNTETTGPDTQVESSPDSPPADFMKQIVPTLESAMKQASDANQAIEMTHSELSKMGFSGDSINDVLSQMRESIHSARMELETLIPGETTAGLYDGKATLEALVMRMKHSYSIFINERNHARSLQESHRALQNQFNQTLEKLEVERARARRSEEFADSSAEDLLHIRMSIQKLEAEAADQVTTIERFNQALNKYHEESKNYEAIIAQLEEQKEVEGRISAVQIADLEAQISKKSSIMLEENSTLTQSVKDKDIRINDLVARVQVLEADNARLVDELAKHEHEIGTLNARHSQVSTALQSATMDLEKAQRINEILESQCQQEAASRDRVEQWFATVMDEGKKVLRAEHGGTQGRRTRINELLSDGLNSEPSLPENSPSKAVRGSLFENVRVGRGKDKRFLEVDSDTLGRDSGIGTDHGSLEGEAVALSDVEEEPTVDDREGSSNP